MGQPLTREPVVILEAWGVSGGKHDPEKGVVFGVKVLGLVSRNGRRYSPAASRKAIPLIEAAGVYVNHPLERPLSSSQPVPRLIQDRFARLKNIQPDSKGELFGDLHYRKKHWFTEQFREAVDDDPVGIGLSLNAHGYGARQSDGMILVEEITKVNSVDLVDGPATTMGLWEQTDMADPLAPSLDTGMGSGGDWRAQLGELIKSIAMDASLDKAACKKKIMQALKLLDDSAEAGPANDTEMMEQLRAVPLPVARKAGERLDGLLLRERVEQRKEAAKKAGLPEIALTEQFISDLAAAPDTKVAAMIADRHKLLQAVQKPISLPDDFKVPGAVTGNTVTDLSKKYFG